MLSKRRPSRSPALRVYLTVLLLPWVQQQGLCLELGTMPLVDPGDGADGQPIFDHGHEREPDEQDAANPGWSCRVTYGGIFGVRGGANEVVDEVEVSYVYEIETSRYIAPEAMEKGMLRKIEVALNEDIVPSVFKDVCPDNDRSRGLVATAATTATRIRRRRAMETAAGLSTSPPDQVLRDVPCRVITTAEEEGNFCTSVEGKLTFYLREEESGEVRVAQSLIKKSMESDELLKVDESIVRVAYARDGPYPTLVTPLSAGDKGGGDNSAYVIVGASAAVVVGAVLVVLGLRMRNKEDAAIAAAEVEEKAEEEEAVGGDVAKEVAFNEVDADADAMGGGGDGGNEYASSADVEGVDTNETFDTSVPNTLSQSFETSLPNTLSQSGSMLQDSSFEEERLEDFGFH